MAAGGLLPRRGTNPSAHPNPHLVSQANLTTDSNFVLCDVLQQHLDGMSRLPEPCLGRSTFL